MMAVREAREADYEAVVELLGCASLPAAGVSDHFKHFLVATNEHEIVGAIGLEVYDDDALLRSAVVKSSVQNKGIGSRLFNAIVNHANSLGIRRLILLTNTAEQYFTSKGFKKIDESSVTGRIRTSVEFTGACPSHAACMELILSPEGQS